MHYEHHAAFFDVLVVDRLGWLTDLGSRKRHVPGSICPSRCGPYIDVHAVARRPGHPPISLLDRGTLADGLPAVYQSSQNALNRHL
jgi:hypothetical protein